MPVTLSSLAGAAAQFFDNNGVPLAGGLIYTYNAGTTTPAATYTSSTGVTPHANPIVLDAAGRIATGEVWLTSGVDYKFLVKTSANVQLGSYDNIPSINDFTSIYADLANTTNPALGDALVGFRQSNNSGNLSGAVGRTVHQKLQETVSVQDFGAVGDGVADDTAAIQAAIDALTAGGKVYFPLGSYLVTSTIVVTYANISLIGYNSDSNYNGNGLPVTAPSKIISSSTTGEVVRINKNGCSIYDLTIDASPARLSGANSSGYGIRVEPVDSASGSVSNTTIENVHVVNQPSHGVVLIGTVMRVFNIVVDNCGGIGLVVNGGTITGRTNVLRPGQIDIQNCIFERLGGYGLAIGDTVTSNATLPYRIFCHNIEIYFVRLNASYLPYSIYCFGENICFDGCATDGTTPAGVIDHAGMYTVGFNILIINHRFISCATQCVYIDVVSGFQSTNIKVQDFYVTTSPSEPNYDPAIYVHPSARSINVRFELSYSKITTIVNFASQVGLVAFYNGTLLNNSNSTNGSDNFYTSQSIFGNAVTPWQQYHGVTTAQSTIGFSNWSSVSGASANLNFFRSKSGVIGTKTAVINGTDLASFVFCGDDGTNYITGAGIKSYVDGTPSTGVMPASIAFYTTPAGSGTLVNRLTIKETGATRFVPQTTPVTAQAGDVYYDSGTNKLRCYNGATWNDLF